MLTPAIILITAALLLYTAGVWAEHLRKELRWSHVVLFGLGLVCDTTGTELMRQVAVSGDADFSGSAAGILTWVMAVTGGLALVLMAVHLIWAIVVMLRGTERARATFHRFSRLVWAIWLVPYFTGMAGAMIS